MNRRTATGHRGEKSTVMAVSEEFFWSTLKENVKMFSVLALSVYLPKVVLACLVLIVQHSMERRRTIRYNSTILKWDRALQVQRTCSCSKTTFLLMSGCSRFLRLMQKILLDWCSSFTPSNALMSDGGNHFINETLHLISKGLKVLHHSMFPYTP